MKSRPVTQGRFVKENIREKIHASGLKVGMYIVELDRPWEDTPFLFQGFTVESLEDIETVMEHCEYVYVEVDVDAWLPPVERAVSKKRSTPKYSYAEAPSKAQYEAANSAYNNARSLTKTVFEEVALGGGINVKAVEQTVSECVKSVLTSSETMLWLSRIRKRDDYTAEHSVNVGLLAIGFGKHMEMDEESLNKLGVAAMLHDVGKMRTPLEILNKPQRLTEDEFKIMRSHTVVGRDLLMAHKEVTHGAIDVAYGHHEAMDGSGYPRKIKATGITDMTRMVTLCDVYDAITADRVYKKGASSVQALRILFDGRGTKFDKELTSKFIEYIGLYPPGSIVILKNGAIAIVTAKNYKYRHLPRLLVVLGPDKEKVNEKIVDLARLAKVNKHKSFLISEVLPNGAFGIRIEDYVKRGLQLN